MGVLAWAWLLPAFRVSLHAADVQGGRQPSAQQSRAGRGSFAKLSNSLQRSQVIHSVKEFGLWPARVAPHRGCTGKLSSQAGAACRWAVQEETMGGQPCKSVSSPQLLW